MQNFLHTSYLRAKNFFWRAEISTPIFENFHLWDFFSKKLIFFKISNWLKITSNSYFYVRLTYVVHLWRPKIFGLKIFIRNFYMGQKFLSNFGQNEKKWLFLDRNFRQKFLTDDRNFCPKNIFWLFLSNIYSISQQAIIR